MVLEFQVRSAGFDSFSYFAQDKVDGLIGGLKQMLVGAYATEVHAWFTKGEETIQVEIEIMEVPKDQLEKTIGDIKFVVFSEARRVFEDKTEVDLVAN